MKKVIMSLGVSIAVLFLTAQNASAVPWCHKGSIVVLDEIDWDESQILYNSNNGQGIDKHLAYEAAYNYAAQFSGGGGSINGNSVPNSGEVNMIITGPISYTTYPDPYVYDMSHGLQFTIKKCYTVRPWIPNFELNY